MNLGQVEFSMWRSLEALSCLAHLDKHVINFRCIINVLTSKPQDISRSVTANNLVVAKMVTDSSINSFVTGNELAMTKASELASNNKQLKYVQLLKALCVKESGTVRKTIYGDMSDKQIF